MGIHSIIGARPAAVTTLLPEREKGKSQMSSITETPVNPAVGSDTPPAMFSPEEVVQALRALRERIALPNGDAVVARRRRSAHVDAKFVLAAISAVGVSSGVQQVLGRTDEELRQEVDTSSRWTAVADELRSLLESVVTANAVRRQRIGLAALQTYQICQQLARDENNSRLHAYLGEMKRLNKFGRGRRRGAPPEPPLEPQPSIP